ncbi:MAG: ureidoglycolate lyase [Alphaproteobacteria bacterium]
MTKITLNPIPITRENFAPYGNVIDLQDGTELSAIGEYEYYNGTAIKVIRGNKISMPYEVKLFERHPIGTQAFVPMNSGVFFVVVAESTNTDSFDPNTLKCFITNGRQGIQYNVNVWHAPFTTLTDDADFTVIDRFPFENDPQDINIDFAEFPDTEIIVE